MNPFSVLGVADNAPLDECKKAYRKLCVKYHPDNNGGDASKFDQCSKAFEKIKSGYRHTSVVRKVKHTLSHVDLFNFSVR